MATPVIAIVDIGKTNKKFFLFDESYTIVLEDAVSFSEIADEDGFPCEDIHAITQWVLQSLASVLLRTDVHVKAINFSAHGASFVHVDESGNVILPLYNYFKPFPEELKQQFDHNYSLEGVSVATASPELGHLNSGKQLYRLKQQRPDAFRKIKYSLHLPEYFTYLLTGQPVSGITSIGCHTQLWDFEKNTYHTWVEREGILPKLAPLQSSKKVIPFAFQGKALLCGVGLHDSSAALIPHITANRESFVLLSTGTWSIALNPFNHSPLTVSELKHDCLCYMSYEGKPVKASRLYAAGLYDEQVRKLAERFHVQPAYFDSLNDSTDAGAMGDEYNKIMLSLVKHQQAAIDLIRNDNVKKIWVSGGFSKNKQFMQLLTEANPSLEVVATVAREDSALGAALAIHEFWNDRAMPNFD